MCSIELLLLYMSNIIEAPLLYFLLIYDVIIAEHRTVRSGKTSLLALFLVYNKRVSAPAVTNLEVFVYFPPNFYRSHQFNFFSWAVQVGPHY
jgi:hypothetical protein